VQQSFKKLSRISAIRREIRLFHLATRIAITEALMFLRRNRGLREYLSTI